LSTQELSENNNEKRRERDLKSSAKIEIHQSREEASDEKNSSSQSLHSSRKNREKRLKNLKADKIN
jgi:hypothetical protein